MAEANLNSNLINVFPSTRRTYPQEFSSKLMTEQAIVRIVNTLINKQGFVITKQFDVDQPVEFNIFGYYFQVRKGSDIINLFSSQFPPPTNIYAYIDIDDYNGYAELEVPAELNGQTIEAYDPTHSYVVGNVVNYNGTNYICIANTTGTWDSSKWSDQVYSTFKGLTFTTSQPDSQNNRYSLHVLSYINNSWTITESSTMWFSINFDEIDGGIIS